MLVFMNFLGGNLAADDAAEKAVSGSVSHGLLSLYRMERVVKGLGRLVVVRFEFLCELRGFSSRASRLKSFTRRPAEVILDYCFFALADNAGGGARAT
jgi:hypothetical protein